MKKIKKVHRKKLPNRDLKLLWGLSGGICAYCKRPFIDMENLTYTVHQAHVIARSDKSLPSYREISLEEKDRYENHFLLHPTCHEETKFFSLEELQAIKENHEKHIRDTLNGIYHPFAIGKGKFAKYPHITYYPIEKKFNPLKSYLSILFSTIMIILFFLYIIYIDAKKFDTPFFLCVSLIVFSSLLMVKAIKEIKQKPIEIIYEGDCIFAGCNGKVNIIYPSPIWDAITKQTVPEPGIGICNFDHTHTFTVSRNLSISNRGDYHDFKIKIT
ncbi:hypothetical protein D1632_14545 [Chryseobacterium nematophagum]|uniref:HNH endonuclease n=1 Tax=Chryseobacterium nematophagum TaxID=2305228 RepID=A0A3M7L7R2_9FLAO|nr:hypothetical protein [Chryseobacterium nematophagum]RMZ58798.1 hypothetical protein D1632_14545 [Chryseobacterium nematophagum]